MALYKIPLREVYVLSIVRVLLSGVLFGNYFSIAYSLAGGLLSLTVMALLKKAGGFSVIGISIAGGVCHNIGQLVVAMIVVETFAMSYYMPVLLVAGLITGFLIGVVACSRASSMLNLSLSSTINFCAVFFPIPGADEMAFTSSAITANLRSSGDNTDRIA